MKITGLFYIERIICNQENVPGYNNLSISQHDKLSQYNVYKSCWTKMNEWMNRLLSLVGYSFLFRINNSLPCRDLNPWRPGTKQIAYQCATVLRSLFYLDIVTWFQHCHFIIVSCWQIISADSQQPCHRHLLTLLTAIFFIFLFSSANEASREVANLTERKNPHDPNYFRTG